ncbi:MAG: site-2 protease family protein [Clostridiales Family XIII bacterium]|jgi:Zn-dependent protease|nr:site-2 protease family protein [Clostridiales Family XIII bacterium]
MRKLQYFIQKNPFMVILLALLLVRGVGRGTGGNIWDFILETLYYLPGIVVGITVHEFAHAFAAYKLGDNTPKDQGRVTLNPLAHIDPIGLIALIFLHFGWGKPVQVNPFAFRKNARLCNIVTDLAGVATNFVVAFLFGGLYFFLWRAGVSLDSAGMMILYYAVVMNLVLMVFNLLPIPPLDGFGVVTEIFDLRRKPWYGSVYSYGNIILLVVIITGGTSYILGPAINGLASFIMGSWNAILPG